MPRKTKKQLREEAERWEREAHTLVVQCLIDASYRLNDQSEIGRRARDRLMLLAKAVDPREVEKYLKLQDGMAENLALIMKNILPSRGPMGLTCKRHSKASARQ